MIEAVADESVGKVCDFAPQEQLMWLEMPRFRMVSQGFQRHKNPDFLSMATLSAFRFIFPCCFWWWNLKINLFEHAIQSWVVTVSERQKLPQVIYVFPLKIPNDAQKKETPSGLPSSHPPTLRRIWPISPGAWRRWACCMRNSCRRGRGRLVKSTSSWEILG